MTRRAPTLRPSALALALLFVVALCSCGSHAPRRAVVILLDAARADRFSCYGYERETTPNMDSIAARGHVFTNHFANGVNTRGSMPSFLYSRYFIKPVFPYSKSVALYHPTDLFRVLDAEAVSFPVAFAASGARTAAISAHHWFHADTDFAREFQEFTDLPSTVEFDKKYMYPTGDIVVDHAVEWLDGVDPEEDFLLYLHFMDTHFPHVFEGDAVEFFGEDEYDASRFNERGEAIGGAVLEGRDRDYLDALYDGSLRYTDRELGRLFDHLEAKGWLDDTLIAITSDHGEHLWHTPDRFLHGGPWTDELGHVPMIVSGPGVAPGGRSAAQTQGIDVHPTLLSLLDAPLPPGKGVDGLNMFEDGVAQREWIFTSRAARSEKYKLAFDIDDADMPKLFQGKFAGLSIHALVFDLEEDPTEVFNLSALEPLLAIELMRNYVTRMRPYYQRYHESVADVPPRGSFAVGARDLETQGELREVLREEDVEAVLAEEPSGWVRSVQWGNTWLKCRAGGEPLELRAHVPSGEYTITFQMNGTLEVDLGSGPQPVRARTPDEYWDERHDERTVGPVTVVDQEFRLVVRPPAEGTHASLQHIGFQPVGADASLDGAERTEALRALGYAE